MVSSNHISPQEEQAQAISGAKTTLPLKTGPVSQNAIRRKPVPSASRSSLSDHSDPAPTTPDEADSDSPTASSASNTTTSTHATTPTSSISPSFISRTQLNHRVDHGHLGAQLHVPTSPSGPSSPKTLTQQASAVQTQQNQDDRQPARVLRVMNGVDDSEGYFREPSPVSRPVTVLR